MIPLPKAPDYEMEDVSPDSRTATKDSPPTVNVHNKEPPNPNEEPPTPSEDTETQVHAKHGLFPRLFGNREEQERYAEEAKKRKNAAAAKTAKSSRNNQLGHCHQKHHREMIKPQVLQETMETIPLPKAPEQTLLHQLGRLSCRLQMSTTDGLRGSVEIFSHELHKSHCGTHVRDTEHD